MSPYLLRPRRSLAEVAADRTSWALAHRIPGAEQWMMVAQLEPAGSAPNERAPAEPAHEPQPAAATAITTLVP